MNRMAICACVLAWLAPAAWAGPPPAKAVDPLEAPVWTRAWRQGPLTPEQTRAMMRELAQFVFDYHLKRDEKSAQRGMVYEYYDTPRRGLPDRFVQGEALDTMHDGAWLGAAMVNAVRATGEPFYKEFLTRWSLPFYCRMLNHSDRLFSLKNATLGEGDKAWGKEWLFQEGEKGFVPYWWDDGGSVSLERRNRKSNRPPLMCVDETAGRNNPTGLLKGYSLGSSNHMAQDLGILLQAAWLLLKDSPAPDDAALAAQTAEAAKNLYESRMRHFGSIPMCLAAYAVTSGSADLLKKLPDGGAAGHWAPTNHYTRALAEFKPDQPASLPGFADDQQYRYAYMIARSGGRLPRPLAFKVIYDAYTERLLYRFYSDDAAVPPGINVFDLHPYHFRDGRPADYRSDRKGHHNRPRPVGSRMGPQNMIMCGVALQAMRAWPGVWDQRRSEQAGQDLAVPIVDPVPSPAPASGPAASGPAAAPAWSEKIALGEATFAFRGTPSSLHVSCQTTAGRAVRFKLFARADAQGSWAEVVLGGGAAPGAVNDRGAPLKLGPFAADASGQTVHYQIELPYTLAKGQAAWANGIEHGRLSVRCGQAGRNLYLSSPESQVRDWLAFELGCGLRTWQSVFKHLGYIPTGMGTMTYWDNYSDSGGYAHLISACAQWLLYQAGKNDWEVHNLPQTK